MIEGVEIDDIVDPPMGDIFEPDQAGEVAPPPPFHSPFGIMQHTWTGTDGSVWELSHYQTGVFIVQEALEGLHMPLVDEVNRISPSAHGSTFQGYRVQARDVVWAIYIYTDDSSEAFYDLDRRFFDSMKLGRYGTWRVTRPDGSFRELSMRPVPISFSHERDPGRFGWVKYPVRFLADMNPFWTYPYEVAGSRSTFEDEPGDDFFGGEEGSGPPLYLSPARVEVSREIYNDGDEDVPEIITVNGPMDFVDFDIDTGVGPAREYHLDCNLDYGEWIKIDTRPHTFSVTDHTGANRMKSLNSWIFDPFPTKETTKVNVYPQGLGGGSVVVDADPLYHRAW